MCVEDATAGEFVGVCIVDGAFVVVDPVSELGFTFADILKVALGAG